MACLSDAERAAVGFVSVELVSHCSWDSLPEEDAGGHLDCPLTTALGFGFQCEEPQRAFLAKWLGKDLPSLCQKKPDTAYQQEVLVELSFSTVGRRTTVKYEGAGTLGPGAQSWSWKETLVFERRGEDKLTLVSRAARGNRPKRH